MLPDDGEELLQKLSSEMGLPDFMSDVAMDMDPYLPPTMGEDEASDSTASSEAELGPLTRGCSDVNNQGMSNNYGSTHASSEMDAVAADLLSSGVLDQIMVDELSNVNTAEFADQDTKPFIVNDFDSPVLNSLSHQGNWCFFV